MSRINIDYEAISTTIEKCNSCDKKDSCGFSNVNDNLHQYLETNIDTSTPFIVHFLNISMFIIFGIPYLIWNFFSGGLATLCVEPTINNASSKFMHIFMIYMKNKSLENTKKNLLKMQAIRTMRKWCKENNLPTYSNENVKKSNMISLYYWFTKKILGINTIPDNLLKHQDLQESLFRFSTLKNQLLGQHNNNITEYLINDEIEFYQKIIKNNNQFSDSNANQIINIKDKIKDLNIIHNNFSIQQILNIQTSSNDNNNKINEKKLTSWSWKSY
jgi:hypothetical protein